MKILHIVENLSLKGGSPEVVYGLTESLARKGVEVAIFTVAQKWAEKSIPRPQQVELRIFSPDFFARWWPGYSSSFNRAVKREIFKFDLIHIHEPWHYPHFIVCQTAKRAGKPYIISPHGALEPWCLNFKAFKKKIFATLIQKRIFQEASALHALTEEEAKNIRSFGVKNTIVIIPNGIAPKEFLNLPAPEEIENFYPNLRNKKVILFLGRIHPKKGLDLLVEVLGRIAKVRNDISLLIAGPDNEGYKNQLEKMSESKNTREKIIFTGMLTGRKKLAALSRADVFVLPSYSEGFSMAVLEAMICGLPVILSDKCNFPEVVIRKAGEIIEPRVDSLTKALNKLLDNRKLCKEMGKNAQKLILEKFTWDRIADQMIHLYQEILWNQQRVSGILVR